MTSAGLGRARLLLPLPKPARVSITSTGAGPWPHGIRGCSTGGTAMVRARRDGTCPPLGYHGQGSSRSVPQQDTRTKPVYLFPQLPAARPLETARWDNN